MEYIADQLDLDPLDPMYRTFSKIFQVRLYTYETLLGFFALNMIEVKHFQAFKIVDPEDEKKMAEEEVTSHCPPFRVISASQ